VNTDTSTNKKALIIDDEPDLCELAEITLSRMNIDTFSVHDVSSAKNSLKEQHFDLCLTDMNLPDGNGIEIVEYIQQKYPHIPVAVITAYGNMETAIQALKSGAFDFVSKPVDLQDLRKLVSSAISLPENISQKSSSRKLLGESAATQTLRKQISKLARSQAPVFIQGESGSGKELAAHSIHDQGMRSDQPFIAINCGAIPAELMESEFFGHKKGSFTGASTDKQGLFKAADKGTLFLDEVADLPLSMQVKLLRAIQEKTIRPVGSNQEEPVDIRVLSASHKNLSELVNSGKFREDLFYRINVIELNIPSLRERQEDIIPLAEHLLKRFSDKQHESLLALSDEASNHLNNYHFPGNIRELENILERAIALTDSEIIEPEDLQLPKHREQTQPQKVEKITDTDVDTDLKLHAREHESIIKALDQTRWNKTAAAKLLGISLRQLRYRINKYNIK